MEEKGKEGDRSTAGAQWRKIPIFHPHSLLSLSVAEMDGCFRRPDFFFFFFLRAYHFLRGILSSWEAGKTWGGGASIHRGALPQLSLLLTGGLYSLTTLH